MLLESVILRGDRASQPAANTVAAGSIYFVTDELVTERSDRASWETYSGSGGGTIITGNTTLIGLDGRDGYDGEDGISIIGPPGPTGATGATGATGPAGSTSLRTARNWCRCRAVNGATAIQAVGIAAPSPQGTVTANHQVNNSYQQYRAAASLFSGLDSGGTGTGFVCQAQHDPDFTINIRTGSSLADLRFWIILTDTVPSSNDDIGGTSDYFGFRYSTVAGDAGWMGVSRDGTTQSLTIAVAAIAVDTNYTLRFRKVGTDLFFSVNGGVEIAKTTNLPQATTDFGWYMRLFEVGGAVTKDLNFSSMYCEYGSY